MYFTKANKTLRFLNRINDNVMRGTCFLYGVLNNTEIITYIIY
jgi:hypothetical protein